MVEGFWTVQFQGPQGPGGGVVVFTKGRILGGDGGYTYSGTYQLKGTDIAAKVAVSNFIPGVPNVMGLQGNFQLEFSGLVNATSDGMNVAANVAGMPGRGMNARLAKVADLP